MGKFVRMVSGPHPGYFAGLDLVRALPLCPSDGLCRWQAAGVPGAQSSGRQPPQPAAASPATQATGSRLWPALP